jgi:hypothetical protein
MIVLSQFRSQGNFLIIYFNFHSFEYFYSKRTHLQSRNSVIQSLRDPTANSLREHYSRLENNQTRLLTPSSSPYYDRFEPVSIAR